VNPFTAYRIFDENGRISGRLTQTTLDGTSPGDVVIKAAYSSVNYKDALAATGAGRILRRFPLTGGIDVAGAVVSSDDGRFNPGDLVLVTGYDLGVAHDGGFAEYVRVPGDWVVPLPEGLTPRHAMTLGTAGFTAGLSIVELERNDLKPGAGPVVVTGATGGVGSVAVAALAALGYQVTAVTGKTAEHEYLRSLGAAEILPREAIPTDARPLGKSTWAGAVDAVGGAVLAGLLKTMNYGAAVANSGLTAGTELHTTVLPFILRGVKLLGIDSVFCPMARRREVWARLAAAVRPSTLETMAQEIPMAELPVAFDTLLRGAARGRFVVRIA